MLIFFFALFGERDIESIFLTGVDNIIIDIRFGLASICVNCTPRIPFIITLLGVVACYTNVFYNCQSCVIDS